MSLLQRLKTQIAADGPMTVAQYMTACLHDPAGGYYATRPSLGADGDFVTAPLVSQMFGELVGLWAVEVWIGMGRPPRVRLVEVGPGDGTLMADALRAARLEPAFLAAADLWLVETSGPLVEAQRQKLAAAPLRPSWAGALSDLPAGAPIILLANELLDCLPARQFLRAPHGWAERMVGLDGGSALAFGLASRPLDHVLPPAEPGTVVEFSPAQEAFGAELGALIAYEGGAAVLIDYGRAEPGFGDTLQALQSHQKVAPLSAPGEADLTVHVDFPAVAWAARRAGARVSAITAQGAWLERLGVRDRAQALMRASPDRAAIVQRQLERLTAPDQMGTLFKALAIHAPPAPLPPGFEPSAEP